MKKYILILLAILIGSCGNGTEKAQDEVKTLIFGAGTAQDHFQFQGFLKFKEYVEEQTQGKILVEAYPNNEIGVDAEVLEQLKLKTAHISVPSPAVMANFSPVMNLLALPFTFPSQEKALEVVGGSWGDKLTKKVEESGYTVIGYTPFGFRQLSTTEKPVNQLDDFKGLKIRTLQNKMHMDVFSSFGASPVGMPFSELFSALQQGVVDGQENPLAHIYAQRLYEALQYIITTAHVFDWAVMVMDKDFFYSLSIEEQKILKDGAQVAIDYMDQAIAKDDQSAREKMIESGIKFIDPSPEFIIQMRETAKPIVSRYGQEIDKELYDELVSSLLK